MVSISPPRVMVTGGAGFIGSHVVDELLQLGHAVLVFDNFSAGNRDFLPANHSNLTVVQGDILDGDALARAVSEFRPTHVAHMAALHFIPYCVAHPLETIDVNIKGTEQVLRSVATADIRRVLVTSSAAVYAPSADPHDEVSSLLGPTDIYGFSKYANETQGRLFQRETGAQVILARVFNAYGPRETNPHLIPEIVSQMKSGNGPISLGNMTTKRSYVFVKDLARALAALILLDQEGCEVYNIGSHAEYNAEEILQILGEVAGREIPFTSVAARQRPSDRPRLQPALGKIENVLGWSERYDIRTGLREIIDSEA